MFRKLLRHWKVVAALTVLGAWLAAEQLDLLRSDSIQALVCTRDLLRPRPAAGELILQYREVIAAEAARQDLPPELLATIIFSHQEELSHFRRFTDCSGSAVGSDLSLGLGQIRISTAVSNDGLRYAGISNDTFKSYRALLLDPQRNIRHLAKEVRRLLARDNRFPDLTAQELIHQPFVMALAMSEYRMGRQSAGAGTAKLGASGLWDLGHLQRDEVYVFGREAAEVLRVQGEVQAYLDYVFCEKGIFNPSACERRRQGAGF